MPSTPLICCTFKLFWWLTSTISSTFKPPFACSRFSLMSTGLIKYTLKLDTFRVPESSHVLCCASQHPSIRPPIAFQALPNILAVFALSSLILLYGLGYAPVIAIMSIELCPVVFTPSYSEVKGEH